MDLLGGGGVFRPPHGDVFRQQAGPGRGRPLAAHQLCACGSGVGVSCPDPRPGVREAKWAESAAVRPAWLGPKESRSSVLTVCGPRPGPRW